MPNAEFRDNTKQCIINAVIVNVVPWLIASCTHNSIPPGSRSRKGVWHNSSP